MVKSDGHKQLALVLLCTALFLDSMDLSLMGVALAHLGLRTRTRVGEPPAPA